MRVLFTYQDAAHAAEIEYAAAVLLGGFDLELICTHEDVAPADHDLRIAYGPTPPSPGAGPQIFIAASDLLTRMGGAEEIRAHVPGKEWGVGSDVGYEREGDLIRTHHDFVAATYFHASRAEEHATRARDAHDRFRAADSHAARHGHLARPIIDEWAAQLQAWCGLLGLPLARRGGDFYIGLTHDVDQVSGGWAEAIFHALKQRHRPGETLRTTAAILRDRMRGRDPYWTFAHLLAIETELGVRSSFYFLPRTGQRRDARYDWNAPRFRELFDTLRAGGWEIGLHGSYAAVDQGCLSEERTALEHASRGPIIGGRQHYLRFDVRTGFDAYQEAGLRYDSSLGYAEALGFRAGLCRPYRPFCPLRRTALELLEIPLIIMDTTLRNYLKVPVEEVWARMLPCLEQVRAHRGAVAILWHNTYFAGYKFAGYDEIYRRLIRWVHQHDGRCGPLDTLVARAGDFLLCPLPEAR